MSIHNADIAAIFDEIADLLEIQGENPFRIRAYRNAARQMESMGVPAADMVAKDEDLTELPGIGDDLAAKIREMVETGKCKALEKLRAKFPPTITTLLKLPGLGPRRVKTLYDKLKIKTLEQLKAAAREHKIRELEGFGDKTEATILEALEQHAEQATRFKLAVAAQYAEPLVAYLKQSRNVKQVEIAGSYRRCKETVGDLDILATTQGASDVMDRFVKYDEVKDVLAHGETRATARLKCGLQVDLRVVPAESFGPAGQYFTGSKAHNIEIRRLGQERKLKINEYGVFKGEGATGARQMAGRMSAASRAPLSHRAPRLGPIGEKRIAGNTEESVYR